MRKLTDQSFLGQLASVFGLIALVVSLFGGVVLFAADSAIDQKYASDADLKSVQEQFAKQVGKLGDTVDKNTQAVQQTTISMQTLALTMVTIQIRDMEPTIRELEIEKLNQGVQWSAAEERTLRDMQRALSDLNIYRQRLFENSTGGNH